jgi:SAM-dependent methyltransferase
MKEIKSELQFSNKYDATFSQRYARSRRDKLSRRFANLWEIRMARKALGVAGNPESVLDLPCGTGRFWTLLAEAPTRRLLAGDSSLDMIETAKAAHPAAITGRFHCLHTDALHIDLPANAVDNIFCMRLMHHVHDPATRIRIYREFGRVAKGTICVSLRVDGNFSAWRRERRHQRKGKHGVNRNVIAAGQAEQELVEAGLRVIGKVDLLPYYSMWRTYVLQVA